MATGKPQGKGSDEEDLSMEEILQSIRSIIAEDGDGVKASDIPPGSDILELTEMVKEDGSVVSLKPETPAAPAAAPTGDVLSRIDEALTKPAAPAAAPAPAAPAAPVVPKTAAESDVLSAQAASAAATTLNKLKIEPELPPVVTTPSPRFGSGKTVEDMVAEMLRPMMKDWLDRNLPPIVERIVEREVKRLTK